MQSLLSIQVIYLVCFASMHSLLASLPAKHLGLKILGSHVDPWYMVVFNVIAFITVAPLVYLVSIDPGPVIYVVPSPWFWLMIAFEIVGVVILSRAFSDAPHRFQIKAELSDPNSSESIPLGIKGIYCFVRDPFLLSGFMGLIFVPFMTKNMLILFIIASVYLYLGSIHWEKRLKAQFGEAYSIYEKKVHRTIPLSKKC
jgi:protein-S-isoprenylcysteine O-methyltransferase Ste14